MAKRNKNKLQYILTELENIKLMKELGDIITSSPIFKELILQIGLDSSKEAKELFTLHPTYQDSFTYTYYKLRNEEFLPYNYELAGRLHKVFNHTYVGVEEAVDILLRVAISGLRGESLEHLLWKSTNIVEVVEVLYSSMSAWVNRSHSLTAQINMLQRISHLIFQFLPFDTGRVIFSHDPQDYLVYAALTTVFSILLLTHNVVLVENAKNN